MGDAKEDCKYWEKCYQKNPEHRKKYNHPNEDEPAARSPRKSPSRHLDKNTLKPAAGSKSPSPNKLLPRNKTAVEEEADGKKRKLSQLEIEDEDDKKLGKSPSHSSSTEENAQVEGDSKGKKRKEFDITKEYNEVMKNLEGKNYLEIFQRRVRYSQKAEYHELLQTNEFIRHKFLVEMPEEFYKFWQLCGTIAKKDEKPEEVFAKFHIKLVGPFDYLAGKFHEAKIKEPGDYLRHWRFYYDPPEFQTVFVKTNSGIHYGYWRDDPKDKNKLLMARNDPSKGCEFTFVGGNCFETLLYFLDNDVALTPFNRAELTDKKKLIQSFASANDIDLNTLEALKKERNQKVVTKTFHRAGLVVPFNRKNEEGYRALIESDANLKKILARFETAEGDRVLIESIMESLQPLITAASIAVDECDFGTSLELGLDLFCSGYKELHGVISSLLIPAYSLLKRPQFIAISKAHLENRRKQYNLSIFDLE